MTEVPPENGAGNELSTTDKPIAEPPVQPDISIADPAPLGLAALALTTFVLSLSNLTVWPAIGAAVALAAGYGGLAQLLAGMWEFKRNNTFGATVFTSYGAFWITYFVFVELVSKSVSPADAAATVGTFLLAWGIFSTYMIIPSLRVSVAFLVVVVLLAAMFILLAVGAYRGETTITKIGGGFGVATAAAAWYTSFAGVTNATFKRVIVPVIPLGRQA